MERDVFPRVACLQMPLHQGDLAANLNELRKMLAAARFSADTLVVLPELWASGFDYANIGTLADQTPHVLAELQEKAAQSRIWFAGSLLERQETQESREISNSLFVVGPEGVIGRYQKQHLFRPWQEDRYLTAGKEAQAVQTPFGPIGALVCYDLRFPELSRRQVFAGARLLVVSAQWPRVRTDHWRILLQARAVENQAFVVACNGSGQVPGGELAGHSMIIDPSGRVLAEADAQPAVIRTELKGRTLMRSGPVFALWLSARGMAKTAIKSLNSRSCWSA